MTEFKLSYTASDINERLGRIDNLANKILENKKHSVFALQIGWSP